MRGVQKTVQGFLKCDAALGRVGVLTYQTPAGPRRELRPPDEVFSPVSMVTASDAVVTDMHPAKDDGWIDTKNHKRLSVGHVSGGVHQDGEHLMGQVTITDPKMIELVNAGQRKEVSPGYLCRLDAVPGRWNGTEYGPNVQDGEPYDAIQRDIIHNSVGIGPSNWGRQGSSVSLRLDSLGADDGAAFADGDANALDLDSNPKRGRTMDLIEFKLDGIGVQVSPAARDVIERALSERSTKIAGLEKQVADAVAEKSALQGRCDSFAEKVTALETELKSAPEKTRAEIKARVELESQAQRVLGSEIKFDGKSDREVREMALIKLTPTLKLDGRDDAYVTARFDMAVEDFKPLTAAQLAAAALGTPPIREHKQDGGEGDELDKARAERRKRNDSAWQPQAVK